MHGDKTIEFLTWAIPLLACLPAVAVNVKEYIDLITQKLAKYALHISPPSLCTLRAPPAAATFTMLPLFFCF